MPNLASAAQSLRTALPATVTAWWDAPTEALSGSHDLGTVGDAGAGGAERLLRGLRLAIATIAAAVVLVPGALLRHLDDYRPPAVQIACYLVPVAITCRELYLVAHHRSWGWERTAGIVLMLASASIARSFLPATAIAGASDWAFGITGWTLLVLTFGRPIRLFAALLAAHAALTAAAVATTGDRGAILNFAAGSIGAIGYPLSCAVAVSILADVARRAAGAAREAFTARTLEQDQARLHARRQERFAELSNVARPLLEGLAEGRLDPIDSPTQRACALAGARIRRLLAEADAVDDPLVHELRHAADVAERLGVLVELETRGSWSDPPRQVRRELLDPVLVALTGARSTARLVVVGLPTLLSVSVVADCDPAIIPCPQDLDVTVTVTDGGQTTWVETTWAPPQTPT